eukprot:477795-Prymnesium_polylepis.1
MPGEMARTSREEVLERKWTGGEEPGREDMGRDGGGLMIGAVGGAGWQVEGAQVERVLADEEHELVEQHPHMIRPHVTSISFTACVRVSRWRQERR